jgi:hypothetical protein
LRRSWRFLSSRLPEPSTPPALDGEPLALGEVYSSFSLNLSSFIRP